MADNVAITAGTGTSVATDDVSSVHYQKVKLDGGGDGVSAGIIGTAARGLYVDPHPTLSRIQTASAGLTTATTAYTAGDMLGTIWTFANAVRTSGDYGIIRSATLVDAALVTGATDLYLFDRSVTQAADNAANSWSDADMLFCVGVISFPAPIASALNSIVTISDLNLGIKCNATSLFGCLVTRTAHNFFAAVGNLTISLVIDQA